MSVSSAAQLATLSPPLAKFFMDKTPISFIPLSPVKEQSRLPIKNAKAAVKSASLLPFVNVKLTAYKM